MTIESAAFQHHTTPEKEQLGQWVELALEVPGGNQLGRMLLAERHEEAAWRRLRAAERQVRHAGEH